MQPVAKKPAGGIAEDAKEIAVLAAPIPLELVTTIQALGGASTATELWRGSRAGLIQRISQKSFRCFGVWPICSSTRDRHALANSSAALDIGAYRFEAGATQTSQPADCVAPMRPLPGRPENAT
jgi:hypothetical protein